MGTDSQIWVHLRIAVVSHLEIYFLSHICIGLAKISIWTFSVASYGKKPKRTFWPTQYLLFLLVLLASN